MTHFIIFRSRSQALDCISYLRGAGVSASATNTPKEAGVGCGLSVKFDEPFLPRVRLLLEKKRYSAYSGMMKRRGNTLTYL